MRTALQRGAFFSFLLALAFSFAACDSGGANSSESENENTDSEFNVRIQFLDKNGGFTSQQETDIRNAVDLWKEAITSGLNTAGLPDTKDECSYDEEEVEDLAIVVSKTDIDGPGGTLAIGGTCSVRQSDNTTALGSIELDTGDLPYENPVRTVAHEVGHVLGIGTTWDPRLSDAGTAEPLYKSEHAKEAYEELGGQKEGVPLDKNEDGEIRHWSEDDFKTELMTPESNFGSGQTSAPLSRVSLAALKDIGYSVDLDEAESYSLP